MLGERGRGWELLLPSPPRLFLSLQLRFPAQVATRPRKSPPNPPVTPPRRAGVFGVACALPAEAPQLGFQPPGVKNQPRFWGKKAGFRSCVAEGRRGGAQFAVGVCCPKTSLPWLGKGKKGSGKGAKNPRKSQIGA